jgi:hypothetical protein
VDEKGATAEHRTCLENVRFGSKADICTAIGHVRFTPNSDRKSGHRLASYYDFPYQYPNS